MMKQRISHTQMVNYTMKLLHLVQQLLYAIYSGVEYEFVKLLLKK